MYITDVLFRLSLIRLSDSKPRTVLGGLCLLVLHLVSITVGIECWQHYAATVARLWFTLRFVFRFVFRFDVFPHKPQDV